MRLLRFTRRCMSQLVSVILTSIRYSTIDIRQVDNLSMKTLTCSSRIVSSSHFRPASVKAKLEVMHRCIPQCRVLNVLKVITLNLFSSEIQFWDVIQPRETPSLSVRVCGRTDEPIVSSRSNLSNRCLSMLALGNYWLACVGNGDRRKACCF